ncbi:glycosyl hydrolase family 18 [Demequina sp. TTPB684]|uniref:glycosyl hydrolase family 18 n=1 Tax=unclassified Demequina TaxID=2620311 RepID=UPI001CF44515|nr:MULTISPECIES: glycosyl hydrolase family 18 [unclassified Demequina]MCB2413775.1 glycosyl hydrolase family 18 [Demequina sp. TTPB684]UPU89317.1 glycosyl hydrolase family 18 [Demequina sp. TMPB413]
MTTTRAQHRTRVSLLRVLFLLVTTGLVGWFGFQTVSAIAFTPATPGPSTFSGYVDVTAWPSFAFETPDGPAQSDVTLSFIVSDPNDACSPSWGGYYSLDAAAEELELERRVRQLRDVGGDVRISFGGQANDELAVGCTDPDSLLNAYRSVVDRYSVTTIDLDIEGSALEDAASLKRRADAVAMLQEEAAEDGDGLGVWVTLPVGPEGLTSSGENAVAQLLAAGVDLSGVNGMTMNFGLVTSAAEPQSDTIVQSATALHSQVLDLFSDAGQSLSEGAAWSKVGITPMIGQNDVATEVFTLNDAAVINQFARDNGVGLVSMWSLNRDATCAPPLPSVLTVVQTSCSGVDQQGALFAKALAEDLPAAIATLSPAPTDSPRPTAGQNVAPADLVDDPATSPYPVWDPLGTYPAGTKIVWRKQVYEARFWTSGFAPDAVVSNPLDSPWTLLGPVLPGDTPAPLPTLPEGSYPQWDDEEIYEAGSRVQVGLVPYEAKWWSQGTKPGVAVAGGSPWVLIIPAE